MSEPCPAVRAPYYPSFKVADHAYPQPYPDQLTPATFLRVTNGQPVQAIQYIAKENLEQVESFVEPHCVTLDPKVLYIIINNAPFEVVVYPGSWVVKSAEGEIWGELNHNFHARYMAFV